MDARGLAPAAERPEREVAFDAVVLRERAARMKATARRRVGEVGWSSGNRHEHVAPVVDVGHGAQEAERVGMARLAEYSLQRAGLDDMSHVHHSDDDARLRDHVALVLV